MINQINIRNNFLIRVWKETRGHIHSKLFSIGFYEWGAFFFLSEWFALLYRLTKSFLFLMNYLDFIQGELSYFLLVNLGGDWCLGVGMCFFCKWKTCNVAKLINIICMWKKKRYIEYGFALQRVAMVVTWCFIILTRKFIFISVNL